MTFDVSKFLDVHCGGAKRVPALFKVYRLPAPGQQAVDKWRLRKSIPCDWLVALLCLLELECGAPISLSPFFVSQTK